MGEEKFCIYPSCGKVLTGKQKKYCSKIHSTYYFQEFVAPFWWSNAVKVALRKADNKCSRCGSTIKLQVHHKEKLPLDKPTWDYKKRKWKAPTANYHNNPLNRQDNLEVLCKECHNKEHNKGIKNGIRLED